MKEIAFYYFLKLCGGFVRQCELVCGRKWSSCWPAPTCAWCVVAFTVACWKIRDRRSRLPPPWPRPSKRLCAPLRCAALLGWWNRRSTCSVLFDAAALTARHCLGLVHLCFPPAVTEYAWFIYFFLTNPAHLLSVEPGSTHTHTHIQRQECVSSHTLVGGAVLVSIFHFRALYKASSDAGVLSPHYRNISCFVCYRKTVEVCNVWVHVYKHTPVLYIIARSFCSLKRQHVDVFHKPLCILRWSRVVSHVFGLCVRRG